MNHDNIDEDVLLGDRYGEMAMAGMPKTKELFYALELFYTFSIYLNRGKWFWKLSHSVYGDMARSLQGFVDEEDCRMHARATLIGLQSIKLW